MTVKKLQRLADRVYAVLCEHIVDDDRHREIFWEVAVDEVWLDIHVRRGSPLVRLRTDQVERLNFWLPNDRAWLIETVLIALAGRKIRTKRVREFEE